MKKQTVYKYDLNDVINAVVSDIYDTYGVALDRDTHKATFIYDSNNSLESITLEEKDGN